MKQGSDYSWLFYISFFVAVIMGIATSYSTFAISPWVPYINAALVVLGFIYGGFFINVKKLDKVFFALMLILLASPASSVVVVIPKIGGVLNNVFMTLVFFIAPIALIVGYRALLDYIVKN